MEKGITKQEIIQELTKSPHGNLKEYVLVGMKAAKQDPEFLAHLIAWNKDNGQIRDAKVALPVISLAEQSFPDDFVDNSLAHIVSLDPRNMVKAVRFAKEIKSRNRLIGRTVKRYLVRLESEPKHWDRVAVQHRDSLKTLYAFPYTGGRMVISDHVRKILYERNYPKNSIFWKISQLRNMSTTEAAATIIEAKIPALIAKGALGTKLKDPDVLLALIGGMSATELITNTKLLEELGMNSNPALRAAFAEALGKAATSKKNTLKTSKAVEAVKDSKLKKQLENLQEKQMKSISVEGNWLVLGDKSGSMSSAIEMAREVSGTLAKLVTGNIHLIFFDTSPKHVDVTGKSYEEIKAITKHVIANGGTSIGCGLQYCLDKGIDIDGIAIVTDGGENTTPLFAGTYQKYCKKFEKEPTVYIYKTDGYLTAFSNSLKNVEIDFQEFALKGSDYYSLPNLVQTMRVNRYGFMDKIQEYPLLDLNVVLGAKNATGISANV